MPSGTTRPASIPEPTPAATGASRTSAAEPPAPVPHQGEAAGARTARSAINGNQPAGDRLLADAPAADSPLDPAAVDGLLDAPAAAALTAADPTTDRRGARHLLKRVTIDTRPLRHPPYRRLFASSMITSVGSQLTTVAVPYQIYQVTHSSTWIGIASFAGLAPLIIFGLWGGAVADRMDRRTLLLTTNIGIAATSLAFFAQAAAHLDSIALLIGLFAVQQALFGINSPARGAAIPRLVPAAELPAANSLGSTTMLTGALIGPLLAGALIPIVGVPTLYLIDAIGLTATLWAVYKLPPLPMLATPGGEDAAPSSGWAQVRDGIRFVNSNPLLMLSFAVDLIAMIFGMPRALFPQLAATTFAHSHDALGLLYAAIPAGSLLGGLLSGTFTRARRHGLMTLCAVAAWGAAIACFGLTTNLGLAFAFLALGGAADFVSMVFRSSILQSVAPDDMRGRMQGVFTVVVAGGPRLADLIHGLAAGAVGTRITTTLGGLAVLGALAVLTVTNPAYRRYRADA